MTTVFPEEEPVSLIGIDVAGPSIISDYESGESFATELSENITKSNIFKDIRKFANEIAKEIKNDPNHGYLLLSVIIAIIWAIYIILYNSRIQGHILTTVLRRFIKKGNIKIGSFSISLLWGKLMFRDIVYVTEDYSLRIVDAIIQFHYWLPYLKKELTEDMSKCDHRLWVELNGPELHIYNRSELYTRLEEVFGLDNQMKPKNDLVKQSAVEPSKDMSFWASWRDLLPVVKVDLNMARFVFGNRLVPSTLLLTMDKAECFYSTKPAACSLDYFMHVIKSKAENFRVILAPSPKYTGTLDEPPRYMGEGFVVMSSSKIQFYYYMDEAGIVPILSQNLLIPNGDDLCAPPPIWGLDIKCEKGTNLSYGPWADRQREQLFRLFFPQDYQKMEVALLQIPGEIRQAHQFDIRLSILTEATVDILFTKEKETNAVHMTCQKGSYFEMTLPWIVKNEGYVIRLNGQFLYLDASTSLQYRNLFEAESFKYEVNVKYPLFWNKHQIWDMLFHGSKVTYHFLYIHKEFFRDLIDDWSSKAQPDILNFIPYTWNFFFNFKLFELVTLANEYNWVDCSSQHQANAHVAFCGDLLDLQFSLPSVSFLPEVVPLKFSILGRTLFLSLYLPPTTTTNNVIEALDKNATYHENGRKKIFLNPTWRKFCKLSSGWVNCWQVPELELILGYTYHPMPPLGPTPQANVSTPEKMEILLSPIRAPKKKKSPIEEMINVHRTKSTSPENFDPSTLSSDIFTVELRILQSSEIKLYGSILRLFIHLKENIFGEDQKFIDMCEPNPYEVTEDHPDVETSRHSNSDEKEEEFDKRKYRPFEVTVNIDIRNVTGHLMKDCAEGEPPCPIINLDCLVFEMNKQYHETQMQVNISPLILTTIDTTSRVQNHSHLQQGFLLLSGFQMRGHAMFSDEGRFLWEETIEYSWLVELTVGSLSGKLTTPQLQHVITGLETFIFTAVDNENCLRHPRPYHLCYHGDPQLDCQYTLPDHYCPTVDIIKYKMLRTSIDAIDIHLVETGTDLNLQVFPIRIATCNLHGQHTRSGITAQIENIRLKNYVCGWVGLRDFRHNNDIDGKGCEAASVSGLSGIGMTNSVTAGSSSSTVGGSGDVWVEAAAVVLGPLYIDAAISSNILYHDMQLIQHKFLKQHDLKTKRLWFLWPVEATNVNLDIFGKCGCVGGCNFFGSNRNGKRFFKPSRQDFLEGLNVAKFRLNESGLSPGYGQSILKDQNLVFETYYSCLSKCHYGPTLVTDNEQLHLSSGYTKSLSPSIPFELQAPGSNSIPTMLDTSSDSGKHYHKTCYQKKLFTRQMSQDSDTHGVTPCKSVDVTSKVKSKNNGIGQRRIGECNSLGRQTKDSAVLSVPCGESLTTPGSLTDLRKSSNHINSGHSPLKMPSSLSLQTELPSQSGRLRFSLNEKSDNINELEQTSISSKESPVDSLGRFRRTISIGSEALSEAFYSADEEQMQAFSRRCASISPTSSQVSLPTVPENLVSRVEDCTEEDIVLQLDSSSSGNHVKSLSQEHKSKLDKYLERPRHSRRDSSTSNSSSNSDSSSGTCDYRNETHGHSQTSLLHSSDSDISKGDDFNDNPVEIRTKKPTRPKSVGEDFFSEIESVSSNSFLSAVSSQEDIALVDLHMQLNKPITESPLLMSSYINHMTQLRCSNWDCTPPAFEKDKKCCCSNLAKRLSPIFEKISEGFTAIRMVEGTRYTIPTNSPPSCSNNTPSHPYSWDTPVFIWGDTTDSGTHEEEDEVIGGGIFDANTTRTTVVMKLKKDVDITISPIALESAQRFLDALTPVMESLHPLTIINRTHFKSVSSVEKKNTLKKDRYMYWSRLRDSKKCGTPEQAAVVTSTYRESCFQQVQGQITLPRVNFTLLQASVVEEIISFSALDNIRDLTCVSLFSFCLDGVKLQFYSGHQSKQSVQIFMRNPKVSGKPKKSKSKTKLNVDLFTEPVYIETSERQQEENMISVSVHKLHVQLRRLKNESSLLKDASITAIPNHRSKVMFTFRRCNREEIVEDNLEINNIPHSLPSASHPHPDEERMGFIMFEAGLENVSFK